MSILLETNLPIQLLQRGKVRDVYDLGDKLLIVSTDRISAFDFILPCGIPDKGKVLNQLSSFWFKKTAHIVPNHLIKLIDSPDSLQDYYSGELPDSIIARSMIVVKADRIPVECVVRGYLAGSAWVEYKNAGTVNNIRLSAKMKESQILPQPMFTPTTKSETEHDRPLTNQDIKNIEETFAAKLKRDNFNLMKELEEKSLLIYHYAQDYAKSKGIIIADTKFEFGFINGELALIDELLTPDSSRFWNASRYKIGCSQASFDKQPVRDWLLASGWNKEPPTPTLPPGVIKATTQRYNKIYQLLAGKHI